MKILDKKKQTPEEIKNMQSECLKSFSDLLKMLDGIRMAYKDGILDNPQEDMLKMLSLMGYQKESGWILEFIQSNKRLYKTLDAETKVMKKILKTAQKR